MSDPDPVVTQSQAGRLVGRRVVVTGSASGIGLATARRVIVEGAKAALFDIVGEEDLDSSRWGLGHDEMYRYWSVDVSDPNRVNEVSGQAEAWLGGVDVLLHIAGIQRGRNTELTEFSDDTWHEVLAVNLTGTFLVVKHLLRPLMSSKGTIVLTSSGAGVFGPSGSYAYGASKGGVHGFALTLAARLEPYGVRVNEVAPSLIDSGITRRELGEDSELSAQLASPEGIASIMAFLASPDAELVRGILRTA